MYWCSDQHVILTHMARAASWGSLLVELCVFSANDCLAYAVVRVCMYKCDYGMLCCVQYAESREFVACVYVYAHRACGKHMDSNVCINDKSWDMSWPYHVIRRAP